MVEESEVIEGPASCLRGSHSCVPGQSWVSEGLMAVMGQLTVTAILSQIDKNRANLSWACLKLDLDPEKHNLRELHVGILNSFGVDLRFLEGLTSAVLFPACAFDVFVLLTVV